MSIKVIASDLDGTLMSPDHLTITRRTLDALWQAHEKGVKLAVSTGRPMALIDNVLEQIPFVDYVIYSNGACVYDMNKKELIHADLIDNKTSIKLLKDFLNDDGFFEIYVEGRSHYQESMLKHFKFLDFPQEFIDEAMSTMTSHEDLIEFLGDRGIEKITFYSISDEDMPRFWDKLESYDFSVATSFKGNLEGTTKTADKGSALKSICEANGASPKEAMSFGDGGNDCPMLEYAYYSFAMENGIDACKKSARFLTSSNADDGVAIQIEKYCL